jgi:hypothetical protein
MEDERWRPLIAASWQGVDALLMSVEPLQATAAADRLT